MIVVRYHLLKVEYEEETVLLMDFAFIPRSQGFDATFDPEILSQRGTYYG